MTNERTEGKKNRDSTSGGVEEFTNPQNLDNKIQLKLNENSASSFSSTTKYLIIKKCV